MATGAVFAQSTPRIDARQDNQAARIEQGKATGELTPREAVRLQRGQNRVQGMENRAMADGRMTGGERARIHAMRRAGARAENFFISPDIGRVGFAGPRVGGDA